MITYVDASVLLRVVLAEPGRLDLWEQIDPIASELVRVEALRVVDRLKLASDLDETQLAIRRAGVLDALTRFDLAPLSPEVLERAGDPFPTPLGTLDAIHLASALAIREAYPALAMATHHQELATAARSVGFQVLGV